MRLGAPSPPCPFPPPSEATAPLYILSQLLPGINSAENTHSGGLPKGSR